MNKNTITLKLTKTDARKCGLYYSNYGCLVATALKRRFPGKLVRVRGYDLDLGAEGYCMSGDDAFKVCNAYADGRRRPIPLDLFKPFTITLTRKRMV